MDQENIYIEEVETESLEGEKTKKIAIVLAFTLFAAGVYWYYGVYNPQHNTPPSPAKVTTNAITGVSTTTVHEVQKASGASIPTAKVEGIEVSVKTALKLQQHKVNPYEVKGRIRPSSKLLLAQAAKTTAGKADPFTQEGRATTLSNVALSAPPASPAAPSYSNVRISPLPLLKGLPTLPTITLPGLHTFSNPGTPSGGPMVQQATIELKGFLGNKAIVSVGSETEILAINQVFKGIKVVSIDPVGMQAKFNSKNRIITKKIIQ